MTGPMTGPRTGSRPGPGPNAGALDQAIELFTRIRRGGRWEAAQTHASLVPYLIEETWELADAVDSGDREELRSELGDLLLQLLFHAAIAAEDAADPFDIDDIAQAMLDKLRRRAPYWFDETVPTPDPETQDQLWQEAKAAEKAAAGHGDRDIFAGVSWAQPALALGDKILARCRKAGIPADALGPEVLAVQIGTYGVFDSGESTEARYRSTLRACAAHVRRAHRWLQQRELEAPFESQDWRDALAATAAGN